MNVSVDDLFGKKIREFLLPDPPVVFGDVDSELYIYLMLSAILPFTLSFYHTVEVRSTAKV